MSKGRNGKRQNIAICSKVGAIWRPRQRIEQFQMCYPSTGSTSQLLAWKSGAAGPAASYHLPRRAGAFRLPRPRRMSVSTLGSTSLWPFLGASLLSNVLVICCAEENARGVSLDCAEMIAQLDDTRRNTKDMHCLRGILRLVQRDKMNICMLILLLNGISLTNKWEIATFLNLIIYYGW